MDKKKLWEILKILFKIVFTIVLIFLVFQKIEFKDLKKIFFNSNPYYIFLAFVSYFVSQIVSSSRLLSFFRSLGLNISFEFNFKLFLLGMFYNVFLPGGVGGDGYKVYLLKKKYKLPTKTFILSLLFDRVSGLWAVGLLLVVLIILIPKINIPAALPIIALILGTAIYYFVQKHFFKEFTRNFFQAHIKAGIVQSLQLTSVIFILLSQDFQGKFSPYLFSFLVSSIATVIPLSVGGFGIREYVMTHASGVFDMNQSLAVFVTLTFSILSSIASLPGLYFVYKSKEFEPLPSAEEAEEFERKADKQLEEENLPK